MEKTANVVEIRSNTNDNKVIAFVHEDEGVNFITAGYRKICEAFKIDRFTAENRYYVTKS